MFNKQGFWVGATMNGIKFTCDPVPTDTREFLGSRNMIPKTKVIHNTGNSSLSAGDELHAKFVKKDDFLLWHFTVDNDSITQHLSIYKTGFHAGDGSGAGNSTGIGIEVCENVDPLIAVVNCYSLMLMLDDFIPALTISKHEDYSGKYCPRWIMNHIGWEKFVSDYVSLVAERKKTIIPSHWCDPIYERITKVISVNEKRFNDPITRGEAFKLIDQVLTYVVVGLK